MTLSLPQAVRSEQILKFHYSSKTIFFACIFLILSQRLKFRRQICFWRSSLHRGTGLCRYKFQYRWNWAENKFLN